MFKTVHIVRTVLLCLALCDMCWTRYLAINEETDEFVPDADAEDAVKQKISTAAENLLVLRILKDLKNRPESEPHSKSLEKRQRRCYWSPVSCYG